MSNGTAFGVWLRQRRTQLGLTLQELADQVECSTVLIRKIESGERKPSDDIARRLAGIFDLPADEHQAFLTFAGADLPADRLPALAGSTGRAPWRALYVQATHLPTPTTAFIGRADAVAAAGAALRAPRTRLLTLLGPPGMGKTRLGLRVAETLAPAFPDGVFFVGLAAIHEPGLVLSAIARALGVPETGGQPLIAALTGYLAHKRLLLLLDNFEQVIPAASYVAGLLAAAPALKVLTTSRQALQVRGERLFRLVPLTVPASGGGGARPVEELARYEAVQLFVERATAVYSAFRLTAENAAAVVALCISLDRLPLAIELAAARSAALSPAAMLARLQEPGAGGGAEAGGRLQLLVQGPHDLPARQQTLRRAIGWSYDLLEEPERTLFLALSVFPGGCTPATAGAIVGADSVTPGNIAAALTALASKSLLQVREDPGDEPRFSMLETIREYAREQLQARDGAHRLDREHARYFMRLAEEAEPHLIGAGQQEWLTRLEAEYSNLLAALQWASAQGGAGDPDAVELALRLAGAFWRFWYIRGIISEGREHLAAVLAVAGGAGSAEPDAALTLTGQARDHLVRVAKVLNGAGALTDRQGDYRGARTLHEQALALRRELGDKQGIAGSLNNLGGVARMVGDFDRARALFVQSLALKRELGDRRGIAYALNSLGTVAFSIGDYAEATRFFQESLVIKQELGDQAGSAVTIDNLGMVAYAERDYAQARLFHEESLVMRRALGDRWGMAKALDNLGNVAYREGAYATARELYEESLAHYRELGDRLGIAESLEDFAKLARAQRRFQRAARLWGAAEALRETIHTPIPDNDRPSFEAEVAAARAGGSAETFQQAWQAGRRMSLETALAYATAKPPGSK